MSKIGNILGSGRAETDREMLDSAFVTTHDFKALTQTNDFNFVVGRRGTGKTALYLKISDFFSKDKHVYTFSMKPEEYFALSFRALLEGLDSNYNLSRAICRICWKVNLLVEILNSIRSHWKIGRSSENKFLVSFFTDYKEICLETFWDRLQFFLKNAEINTNNSYDIPRYIADKYQLSNLQTAVQAGLEELNITTLFLFDGLDEGWIPGNESVAILGGLAIAVADFRDSHTSINATLFIRDNIFRALATIDSDFSRHIEGNTLRLNWKDDSLFHLVSQRLRISMSLMDVENNIKVWNRFARRKLEGRDGFRFCLQYTLYRPRDILVLLNQAFIIAARTGRTEIIDDDVESTSRQIAHERLSDLISEYSHVFPGIGLFIQAFKGRSALSDYKTLISYLNSIVNENSFSDKEASDFAVLGSGTELFNALYSIGFLGLKNQASNTYLYCHDGARSNLNEIAPDEKIMIHPCYWKALEISNDDVSTQILVDINDEYSSGFNPKTAELRTQLLGQLVDELPALPIGQNGSSKFEKWVFRAIKIIFAGPLTNPELKANKDALQRRDIVATNMAEKGFWKRIIDDYKSRQIIFEVKNYEKLTVDDYRQALSYCGRDYGNFVVIINRSTNEIFQDHEKAWIKEMYDQQGVIIFSLPAVILARCIRKLRNPKRTDYADAFFSKRLDQIVRTVISMHHKAVR